MNKTGCSPYDGLTLGQRITLLSRSEWPTLVDDCSFAELPAAPAALAAGKVTASFRLRHSGEFVIAAVDLEGNLVQAMTNDWDEPMWQAGVGVLP
jgi:hypothetical protein